jgi:hypothetical protein
MKRQNRIVSQELASGQVWQMDDSHLQVGLVGKHLVHYKLVKGKAKRTSTSLSGKKAVEKFLKDNKAVLVTG